MYMHMYSALAFYSCTCVFVDWSMTTSGDFGQVSLCDTANYMCMLESTCIQKQTCVCTADRVKNDDVCTGTIRSKLCVFSTSLSDCYCGTVEGTIWGDYHPNMHLPLTHHFGWESEH